MKNIFLALFAILFATHAEDVNQIQWTDLVPKIEYDDPFLKLTDDQKSDLGMLLRLRKLIEAGKTDSEESLKEEKELTKRLTEEGIKIDFLFSKVDEIRAKRIKGSKASNTALDNTEIEMAGFVLPLKFKNKKVVEFLLVPWIGACIHTPPPPPNQIVHVTSEAFAISKPFDHFKIRGQLKLVKITKELFLKDGTGDVNSSYQIQNAQVRKLLEDFD